MDCMGNRAVFDAIRILGVIMKRMSTYHRFMLAVYVLCAVVIVLDLFYWRAG